MKKDSDFNALVLDYRALTPAQWITLRDQLIRRAEQERAAVIRGAFRAMVLWLRRSISAVWATVFTTKHPVFPSRGA